MAVGRNGTDGDGQGSGARRSPAELADAILTRIRGRDLPAGAMLDPDMLATMMDASRHDVLVALTQLEKGGFTARAAGQWTVRADRDSDPRELLARGQPLLVAMARLAAENGTPAEAAAIAAARDRFAGLAGDGSVETRSAAYCDMLLQAAGASGSRFHLDAVARLLDEAAPLIPPIVRHNMACFPDPSPDSDLARFARALMQRDPESATQAMEDHLLLIGRHMDHIGGPMCNMAAGS